MSKITNDGLTCSATGCFIVVPMWQQWASKGSSTLNCIEVVGRVWKYRGIPKVFLEIGSYFGKLGWFTESQKNCIII